LENSVLKTLALTLLLAVGAHAAAKEAAPASADPALEARVMAVAEELRCLVCQNENIAASNAELAVDLRKQIRSQLAGGRSQQQILDYMVERYGDFVLYNPPLKASTLVLWGGPFVLLLVGLGAMAANIRRRRHTAQAPLGDADRARAQRLLDGAQGQGGTS
jgi:cytochrome c-type biogenesis protein CcmH